MEIRYQKTNLKLKKKKWYKFKKLLIKKKQNKKIMLHQIKVGLRKIFKKGKALKTFLIKYKEKKKRVEISVRVSKFKISINKMKVEVNFTIDFGEIPILVKDKEELYIDK